MQNISHVMETLGQPRIGGYKPASNVGPANIRRAHEEGSGRALSPGQKRRHGEAQRPRQAAKERSGRARRAALHPADRGPGHPRAGGQVGERPGPGFSLGAQAGAEPGVEVLGRKQHKNFLR